MEPYITATVRESQARQARLVWLSTMAIIALWLALIVAPALSRLTGDAAISSSLYSFFSYICHQMPSRCFHIGGEPFGVCSRCFGVYFGLLAGAAVYPFWRELSDVEPISRMWLALALVPITIDWSLTFFGIWENTQLSRFATGAILGAACATFIVPAVVEITRNLTLAAGAKRAA
jgi:uncharacterized membrane protein